MNYKVIFIIILFLMIIILGVWLLSRRGSKQSQITSSPSPSSQEETLATVKPEDLKDRLDENFKIAQSKATEWQKSAEFVFIKVQISSDLHLKKISEIYVFGSSQDSYYWWTANIDLEGNYLRAKVPRTDFLADQRLIKIATGDWKISWIEAFQKAEAGGGKDFRQKYGDDLEISASLGYFGTEKLAWQIVYKSLTDEIESKEILISADSGEIIPQPSET